MTIRPTSPRSLAYNRTTATFRRAPKRLGHAGKRRLAPANTSSSARFRPSGTVKLIRNVPTFRSVSRVQLLGFVEEPQRFLFISGFEGFRCYVNAFLSLVPVPFHLLFPFLLRRCWSADHLATRGLARAVTAVRQSAAAIRVTTQLPAPSPSHHVKRLIHLSVRLSVHDESAMSTKSTCVGRGKKKSSTYPYLFKYLNQIQIYFLSVQQYILR